MALAVASHLASGLFLSTCSVPCHNVLYIKNNFHVKLHTSNNKNTVNGFA